MDKLEQNSHGRDKASYEDKALLRVSVGHLFSELHAVGFIIIVNAEQLCKIITFLTSTWEISDS